MPSDFVWFVLITILCTTFNSSHSTYPVRDTFEQEYSSGTRSLPFLKNGSMYGKSVVTVILEGRKGADSDLMISQARWSPIKVAFLINRYWTILTTSIQIWLVINGVSESLCQRIARIQPAGVTVTVMSILSFRRMVPDAEIRTFAGRVL